MDLFYWYIICKLLKALTWKDCFFLFYVVAQVILWRSDECTLQQAMKCTRSYEGNVRVPESPWRMPQPWTCCKLGTHVSCWRWGRSSPSVPGQVPRAACPVGARLLTPPPSSAPRHFDDRLDMWLGILGLRRMNHNVLTALDSGQVLVLGIFRPLSRGGTEKIKRGGGGVMFWEKLTSQMEIALFCWILCYLS